VQLIPNVLSDCADAISQLPANMPTANTAALVATINFIAFSSTSV